MKSYTYNFDELIDRRESGCSKWSGPSDELPMWVADMDFQAAPPIRKALQGCLDHGVFGYFDIPDSWADAYANWWERRHHFTMDKEQLIFTTGIVPALSTAVRKLTDPAEKVLVQTPCYNIFFNSIVNNGRYVVESPLKYDGLHYEVDWEGLESQLSDPQVRLMILCNPHNPVGKIWDRETLAKIGELCAKYHVTVFSDEIHCDLTAPGTEYIPFASVSETCKQISVIGIAPTKTFNLAGLHTAAVYSENPLLRHKMWRGLNTDEVAEPNAFAIAATLAAFNESEDWLEELRDYVWENKKWLTAQLNQAFPKIKAENSDATYLLWLDCSAIIPDTTDFCNYMRQNHGLRLAAGDSYGTCGAGFIRWNLAAPRSRVEEGFKRFQNAVQAYLSTET